MAVWHFMFGISLVVTFITIIVNQRTHRAISNCSTTKYFSSPDENCPICLHNLTNDEMRYLRCGHALHAECLKNLKRHGNKICPTCRIKI